MYPDLPHEVLQEELSYFVVYRYIQDEDQPLFVSPDPRTVSSLSDVSQPHTPGDRRRTVGIERLQPKPLLEHRRRDGAARLGAKCHPARRRRRLGSVSDG